MTWTTVIMELQQNWIKLDVGFREPVPSTPLPWPQSDIAWSCFLWTPEPCSGIWHSPFAIHPYSTALPWMMQSHGTMAHRGTSPDFPPRPRHRLSQWEIVGALYYCNIFLPVMSSPWWGYTQNIIRATRSVNINSSEWEPDMLKQFSKKL